MKRILIVAAIVWASSNLGAQIRLTSGDDYSISFTDGKDTLRTPPEGLWSVATKWNEDWPAGWVHAMPESMEISGQWTILKGTIKLPQGEMLLRDAYSQTPEGMIHCVRRWEWKGKETLQHATLSVRLQRRGNGLSLFAPGIVYYGNSNGAAVNQEAVPVWTGAPGELAVFEDHRYPMPFVMLEDAAALRAIAVHTVPSPVRGAVLTDQWWSFGAEAYENQTEVVMYSGPIGYNGTHGVAKARQKKSMRYADTWLDLEPGRIVEKEFFIDLYDISRRGTGFQRPLYSTLDRYKPYDAERFCRFDEIVAGKARYAASRWMENGNASGFDMYDPRSPRKHIVMGWCGQADSPGYSLQVLEPMISTGDGPWTADIIHDRVQRSMDFLTECSWREDGLFCVRYKCDTESWDQGDPVSCGQAMYNFAKAIEYARKHPGTYNTSKWEVFLKQSCDRTADNILSCNWNPKSTAEAFYIAPLAIASKLFGRPRYRKAAEKAAGLFAKRHLEMDGCYWGGTLDATCEDKEGAWAAFQGFLECYGRFGNKKYLEWAKHAMDVCLSYVAVWDIPLPAGRLADRGFKSTGWTVVSPQNQHLDVYGVLFAPEVCRMGRLLGDERLVKLSKVMYRTCYQLTDAYGSQGEQVQHTNFAQHGDMSNVYKLRGGYSETWTVFWITAHFLNAAARFIESGEEL
ncbi:MAG: hypothetical protein J5835_03070 [Bacteroidales bacterium]|nr:hypothetical protein [Bacteroidales bacterium]